MSGVDHVSPKSSSSSLASPSQTKLRQTGSVIRMATGSGGQQNLRKAFVTIKDSTKVGLKRVNGDNKGLDIAILKATNHDIVTPKEKHVKTLFYAVSASSPRSDVCYCISTILRRLSKTHNWTVALKVLIVLHRALREVDPSFREELISFGGGKGFSFNLAHFRDDTSPQAWEYSAWIRTYAMYLEERLECFRVYRYDVARDQLRRNKELDVPVLLDKLPPLQKLLYRLLACKPEGAALDNSLILYTLSIIASESVRLYVTITNGILTLIDKYFGMERDYAVKTLEIYLKSDNQAEQLSEFFETCRSFDFGRGQKYIKIRRPPPSFLTAMEDYLNSPKGSALPRSKTQNDEVAAAGETSSAKFDFLVGHTEDVSKSQNLSVSSSDQQPREQTKVAAPIEIPDLLSWDDIEEASQQYDVQNQDPLANAIVTPEDQPSTGNVAPTFTRCTSWEVALVNAAGSGESAHAENALPGSLDKLTLNSLYEQAIRRGLGQDVAYQIGQPSSNPFATDYYNQDLFSTSHNSSASNNTQTDPQQPLMLTLHRWEEPWEDKAGSENPVFNPFDDPMPKQQIRPPTPPADNSHQGLF